MYASDEKLKSESNVNHNNFPIGASGSELNPSGAAYHDKPSLCS
jgi:hypothetical protein